MQQPPPVNDPAGLEKSQRSVFVGNIPYEATEEKLKEIFSEVGPVISFKLVYDRENGKPKGYGFCEFQDAGTALSAMRNLNGYEIGGRTLRVDNACAEKNHLDMQNALPGSSGTQGGSGAGAQSSSGPGGESQYGPPVDPQQAPESISKAVASLPPENMFELMKQMKQCIENNPDEARTMLTQNPQLSYALLQAQVVMRIVDPDFALNILHKNPQRPLNYPQQPQQQPPTISPYPGGPPGQNRPFGGPGMPPQNAGPVHPHRGMPIDSNPQMPGRFGDIRAPPPGHMNNPERNVGYPHMDSQANRGLGMTRDPREDRYGGRDPRSRDPRGSGGSRTATAPPPPPFGTTGVPQAAELPSHLAGADPDKAKLIKQVLMLTEEQIAMLPADQRESIIQLKRQINTFN